MEPEFEVEQKPLQHGLPPWTWNNLPMALMHVVAPGAFVPDLARYPELVWLNDWHLVPGITLAAALFLLGGLPWLIWGCFGSTVLDAPGVLLVGKGFPHGGMGKTLPDPVFFLIA